MKKGEPLQNALKGEQDLLTAPSMEFLYKEYDILKDLYIQVEQATQNIFNFYLTLITTVTGAIVIILQLAEKNGINSVQSQITTGGLLWFAAAIGSVYLSSLTGRYAHMARYAQGMDEIRRFIIQHLHVPVPQIYQTFLSRGSKRKRNGIWRWIFWLFPTGTYQLFIGTFNSLSLSLGTWLFLFAGGALQQAFLAAGIVFVLTFFIYNIYSRWVMGKLFRSLNVQFDTNGDLDWIAGKQ